MKRQAQVGEVEQWAELSDGGRNQNSGYLWKRDHCRGHEGCVCGDDSIVYLDLHGGYIGVFTTCTHKFTKLYTCSLIYE